MQGRDEQGRRGLAWAHRGELAAVAAQLYRAQKGKGARKLGLKITTQYEQLHVRKGTAAHDQCFVTVVP